jgi:hypothetical protein
MNWFPKIRARPGRANGPSERGGIWRGFCVRCFPEGRINREYSIISEGSPYQNWVKPKFMLFLRV